MQPKRPDCFLWRCVRALLACAALLLPASCSASPDSAVPKAGKASGFRYAYAQTSALPETPDAPEGMALAAAADGMKLYLDSSRVRFALRDRQGTLWYSGPTEEEADLDGTAYGEYRRALTSLLTVKTCDARGESAKEYASARHSVEDGTFTVRYLLDERAAQIGFRVDFEFADLSLTVPLVVGIRDNALFAGILTNEIKNTEPDTVVLELGLLPHFGSASSADSGYMLVPDGCGGIIQMNSGAVSSGSFEAQIYGADAAFVKSRKAGSAEEALLPVFGMKKGSGAFLAIIDGCDAYANILASVPGIDTDRNYVYARFRFKEPDSFPLKDLSGKAKDYLVVDTKKRDLPDIRVQYRFLSGDEAGYNGMANAYAAYLESEKGLKKQPGAVPYVLELYGAVRKEKSVLGFPATVSEKLTSFEQAGAILKTLEQNGLDTPAVRYQYATDSRIKARAGTQVDLLSLLGGKKAYQSFVRETRDKGGQVYLSLNTASVKAPLFQIGSAHMRSIMNLTAYQYAYNPLTGYEEAATKSCLYRPDVVLSNSQRLFQDAAKSGGTQTLAVEALAKQVYSSFGDSYFSREDTKRCWEEAFAAAAKSGIGLMLDGVCAYALPYAAVAVDVPLRSNRYGIVDFDVPFYQLAVSRFIPCVSQPVNLTSNPKLQLLRCIQTGSVPQFSFIAEEPAALQGTELERLFAADFKKWLPDVVGLVKDWSAVREAANGSPVSSFRVIRDGLTETAYQNGTKVIVNTGAAPVPLQGGGEMPAMSYRILP